MKFFLKILWGITLIIFGAYLIIHGSYHDDTDAPGRHSGLIIYTDNKTQLQYIGSFFGGPTPRLAVDGHHLKAGE